MELEVLMQAYGDHDFVICRKSNLTAAVKEQERETVFYQICMVCHICMLCQLWNLYTTETTLEYAFTHASP